MTATNIPPASLSAHAATGTRDLTLDEARFIALVTFRRTGEPVSTPVLFAIEGDRLLVRTAADSGKIKRLRHTSTVAVIPSDSRGRWLGAATTGQARILDPGQVPAVLARLHAKHRIAGPLFTFIRRLRGQRDVGIEIVLDERPQ